jgi:hypothetical protein
MAQLPSDNRATDPDQRRSPGGIMNDSPAGPRPPLAPPPVSSSDRSPWNWLLVLPLLAVLFPPLYNRVSPELFGIPFFYWYQMAVIPVSVACTVLVYRFGGRR